MCIRDSYLPIDPKDVGRDYQAVIRVNSQSGKGGVAYIMKTDHGINMPRAMQSEFSAVVQAVTDAEGGEINSKNMWDIFSQEYLDRTSPLEQVHVTIDNAEAAGGATQLSAEVVYNGENSTVRGSGNGPIAAYANALETMGLEFEVIEYSQRSRSAGDDAEAACYIAADVNGTKVWGVGIAGSTTTASLRAIDSAVNRALA